MKVVYAQTPLPASGKLGEWCDYLKTQLGGCTATAAEKVSAHYNTSPTVKREQSHLGQSLIVDDLGLATEYKLMPLCPTRSTA